MTFSKVDKRRWLALVASLFALIALGWWVSRTVWFGDFGLATERWRAGVEATTIMVDEVEWPYLRGGDGPVLILLHGFSADKDNWTRIARHLTPRFTVIAPDLPGFGEAAAPSGVSYTIDAQTDRLAGFVSALDLREPFYLGGNSMGGFIAGVYASREPDRVRGLWLLDTAGVIGETLSPMMQAVERGESPMLIEDRADYDRFLTTMFVRSPYIPEAIKQAMAEREVAARPLRRAIFEDLQFRSPGLIERAATLTMPTLITWGENDQIIDVSSAQPLHAALPHSALHILPNTGHLPMIERPAATAQGWLMFVDEQGGAR